jgi:hypothetical protein
VRQSTPTQKHAPAKHAPAPAAAHPPKSAAKKPDHKAAPQPRQACRQRALSPRSKRPARRLPSAGGEARDQIRSASTPEDRQSQLKLLIARGKEQSFLTYAEVNDHLPSEIVDPEQIEDIVQMINDMGIPVYEKAPDAESLLMREPVVADDEAAEEAHRRSRPPSTPNSAARPTRCACTCARWARSNC